LRNKWSADYVRHGGRWILARLFMKKKEKNMKHGKIVEKVVVKNKCFFFETLACVCVLFFL